MAVRYVLIGLLGIAALAIGLALLVHPIAGWIYGVPRRSDVPPSLGVGMVGLLLIPIVLLGLVARRAWWAFELDVEASRQRRRRRDRRSR